MAKGVTDKLGNDLELNDLIAVDMNSVPHLYGHIIMIDAGSNLVLRGRKGPDQNQVTPGRIKILFELDVPFMPDQRVVANVVKLANPHPEHKPANVRPGPVLAQ